MEHFARRRRVVALDLGGHGESSLERRDWTMAAFGGDVRAVVEALGLRRVVLVGHSMGGPVILEEQPQLGLAVMPGVGHFLMADDSEEFNLAAALATVLRAPWKASTQVARRPRTLFAPEGPSPK